METALLQELANADRDLPSHLAQLYLDGKTQLSDKQLAILRAELKQATTCDICGLFAGFDNETVCDRHTRYK